MRISSVAALGLFATIGCASSGGSPAGTTESLDIRGPRSSMIIDTRRDAFVTSDTIFTSASRVLDAIPRALASLNFKVEKTDYASLSVATPPTAEAQ